MEEKLEYYNDRDVVYTNHLENLRGRNTKKRYLVPISSNTLASLSIEAAMPALSSLVAGNGEHTGTQGSWRCPADVFTIAGPGSLQTGAAAASGQSRAGIAASGLACGGDVAPAWAGSASRRGLRPVPRCVRGRPPGARYSGGASFVGPRRTAAPPVRAAAPSARRPSGISS